MRAGVAAFILATALATGRPVQAQAPTAVEPLTIALGVQGLIGNTIVDSAPDGTWWIQLHSDGAYDTYLNGGRVAHGVWTYDNGRLCYNPHAAIAYCTPETVGGKKVGDSWTTTGQDGKRYEAMVVKGESLAAKAG